MSELNGRFFPIELIDGMHAVVWQSADQPDWLQIIARFRSKDRAIAYAELEQMWIDDDQDCLTDREELKLLPPPASAPQSIASSIGETLKEQKFIIDQMAAKATAKRFERKAYKSAEESERDVLRVLSENMDRYNQVSLSVHRIGDLADVKSPQFAVNALISKKAIMVAKPSKNGAGGHPTVYQVLVPFVAGATGSIPGETASVGNPS